MRTGLAKEAVDWMVKFVARAHLVQAALEYSGGTHDVTDVAQGVAEGRFQMWCGPNSIMITELIDYPLGKDCHVFLAGGNLGELETMTPRMEAWAKAEGCKRVTLMGRKGWLRSFLTKRAYTPRWYVMAKELT